MISADLLELLRCPQTGQKLTVAEPELLIRGNARRVMRPMRSEGLPVETKTVTNEPLTAALVREDQKVLYPVRDGIPVLLSDEAIVL